MLSFGQAVKRERLTRGWTIEFVAKRLRTHKGYVSGIETRRVPPPGTGLILKYAKLFGLPPKDLVILAHLEKAPAIVRKDLFARVYGKRVAEGMKPPLARQEAAHVKKLIRDGRQLSGEFRAVLKELRARI